MIDQSQLSEMTDNTLYYQDVIETSLDKVGSIQGMRYHCKHTSYNQKTANSNLSIHETMNI